jgi:FkbM family methyltransferase
VVVNAVRFRIPFLLPRWFITPSRVYVNGRYALLRFPEEEETRADCIDCFLRNEYGLGNGLKDTHSILDIGANVGFFSLAARAYYPKATIHAYEPNPRIVPYLTGNTAGFNVQIYPEAVGGRHGQVAMIDEGFSGQAWTNSGENLRLEISQVLIETAVRRLGGIVDLLKLDCEGAEWEILKESPCWKSIRNIRLEYHFYRGGSLPQMKAAVTGLGYRVIKWQANDDDSGILWASRA